MEQIFVFSKTDFPKLFEKWKAFGEVNAPVRVSDQSFAFKPVKDACEIAFEALRTILPPKKFLYPQRETVLRFDGNNIDDSIPEVKPFVVFGVHPCDLAGMQILDKIFMAEPGDVHYINRRDKILIVGLSCLPDKHCFCESMGTDEARGYDMFLTDIGDSYFLQVATAKAVKVLAGADFLLEPDESTRQAYKNFWNDRAKLFESRLPTKNIQALLDMEWDNPLWTELGDRCLSCGNCVPVCPTCYCFDLVDIASLNGEAERVREWDACQFAGFAKVAGNYNFRATPIDRFKFWNRHKLHGFDDPYGLPTCVGCGRCTVSCPSSILDIVDNVRRLDGAPSSVNPDPDAVPVRIERTQREKPE